MEKTKKIKDGREDRRKERRSMGRKRRKINYVNTDEKNTVEWYEKK